MNYITAAMKVAEAKIEETGAPHPGEEILRLYTLLALTTGEHTTCAHVHDAWAIGRAGTRSDHPALVPFPALPAAVAALDEPYRQGIVAAAKEIAACTLENVTS